MAQIIFNIFSWKFVLVVSLSISLLSLLCSILLNNFDIFASSGSIMTIAGVYLTFSHVLKLGSNDLNIIMAAKAGYGLIAPDDDTDEWQSAVNKARSILRCERVGFAMSIIGTLIWGYAGYIKI